MKLHILMIDNYDSFTFNLVQYLTELGASVAVVRNDELDVDSALEQRPDGIVISPGPGGPDAAGISVALVGAASGATPLLGVCLGHQCIGVAFGGAITRADMIMHGKTSQVIHAGRDLFRDLPNPFEATRYHSLVLDPMTLPDCLEITAWTDDRGRRTIMGLRHREHPTFGVQFHPESILTATGKPLLSNFLSIVGARSSAAVFQ